MQLYYAQEGNEERDADSQSSNEAAGGKVELK